MTGRVWHRAYDPGVPPEIEITQQPLPAFLRRSALDHPEATALIFLNHRWTYRELDERVDRFAAALTDLGVEPGARVAIQLPNLPQTAVAFLGVLRAGAVAVMTNPLYVEREIEHQWNDAGVSVAVVADYLFVQRIDAIRRRLPVAHYIVTSIPEWLPLPSRVVARARLHEARPPLIAPVTEEPDVHLLHTLIGRPAAPGPGRHIAMDDLAALQYTGGTTGTPKGAMLTHANLSANAQQIAAWFVNAVPGREVILGALPFFHVFGLTVALGYPLLIAGAIVLIPDPRDVSQIVRNVSRHHVTLLPAVPALFAAMLARPRLRPSDFRSVTACFSGAAPLAPSVLERFEDRTGARIVEGYGLTEASPVTHVNPLAGRRKIGSVGVPCPNTDMKIVSLDDPATELAAGEEGELLVKGPQVMRGYWNRPGESAGVLANGWLRTGDVARVDEDGYCFIVGRKKDLIIVSGYKVYPDEIDAVLAAHPAVRESATVGVPDPVHGEAVKSFVVLREGHGATEVDLIAYCRRELAAYKVPHAVEFLAELPKSAVQKPLRHELRAR
jgi:long-chain acyl-CoA synthetase